MTGADEVADAVAITLAVDDWLEVAYVLLLARDDPRVADVPEVHAAVRRALRRVVTTPAVVDRALDVVTRARPTERGDPR